MTATYALSLKERAGMRVNASPLRNPAPTLTPALSRQAGEGARQ